MDRIGRDCRDRTDDIHLHPRATTRMPPLAFRIPWPIEPSVWQARFAADSPLERTGFVPSVPREAPGIPVVSALAVSRAAVQTKASPADRERYQTVYARQAGAVAAPTAGLHFTPEILAELDRRGVQRTFVTLHVGLGTFAPVKSLPPRTSGSSVREPAKSRPVTTRRCLAGE